MLGDQESVSTGLYVKYDPAFSKDRFYLDLSWSKGYRIAIWLLAGNSDGSIFKGLNLPAFTFLEEGGLF